MEEKEYTIYSDASKNELECVLIYEDKVMRMLDDNLNLQGRLPFPQFKTSYNGFCTKNM